MSSRSALTLGQINLFLPSLSSQPRLCSDPVFLDSAVDRSTTPATEISCRPVVNKVPELLPPSPPIESRPPSPEPVAVPPDAAAPPAEPHPPAPVAPQPANPPTHPGKGYESQPGTETDPLGGGYDDGYEPEMVTVIYDEDTGDIKQAFTDDGEDITHEFEGYDQAHHDHHHHHDHDHDHDHGHDDQARILDLQDLAKEMQHKIAAALTEAGVTNNFDGHDGQPRPTLVDADGRELPVYDVKKLTSQQLEDLLASVAGEAGSGVVVELLGGQGEEEVAEGRAVPPRREETEEDREQQRNRNAFKRMYEGPPVGEEGGGADRRRDEL